MLADLIPPAMTTLAVEGDYAYVGTSQYLVVIDVSDPDNPKQVAYTPLPAPVWKIATAWGRVYVLTTEHPFASFGYSTIGTGVTIFDIRTPTMPKPVGQLSDVNSFSLAAQAFTLYLSSPGAFSILDVRDPQHPITLGSLPTPDVLSSSDISVSGFRAFLASRKGLWVIDISNPIHPAITGQLQDLTLKYSGILKDLSVEGNLAALAVGVLNSTGGTASECILIDLSDPANPVQLSTVGESYGSYPSVALLNHHVYFAAHDETLGVYGVSDPNAPVQLGFGEDPVWGLASAGNRVYVAAGEMGFAIYDDQQPAPPHKRSALLGISTAEDVAVQGDSIYIADGGVDGLVNGANDYVNGGFAVASLIPLWVVHRSLPDPGGEAHNAPGPAHCRFSDVWTGLGLCSACLASGFAARDDWGCDAVGDPNPFD